MQTASEIIAAMRAAVPAGKETLNAAQTRRLRQLTRSLLAARSDAQREYGRFLAHSRRGLALPGDDLDRWLHGKSVLITGGTGCIGSHLMAQVDRRCPARLVSVSRGLSDRWPRLGGAEYATADILDRGSLAAVFDDVRPDVVFHVAAQRDPGLAEQEVQRTVSTNVLGTRNVIAVAAEFEVAQVVCASTGKALRPYSPDVYTASKRAAEWLLSQAAERGGTTTYSAARYTHVVDNSIIYQRLLDWCSGGVIRLHGADIVFYVQSALESAQLLLGAGLGARPGALWVYASTDLGWPISLLDLALGVLARTGSPAPIYFSGYDRGYESMPFPGLYDPLTAGDVSPLLSAFEAAVSERVCWHMADTFPLRMAASPVLDGRFAALEEACGEPGHRPAEVRAALDAMSWSLLDATLEAVPRQALVRAARLTGRRLASLTPEHRRMLAAIRYHAGIGESALV